MDGWFSVSTPYLVEILFVPSIGLLEASAKLFQHHRVNRAVGVCCKDGIGSDTRVARELRQRTLVESNRLQYESLVGS